MNRDTPVFMVVETLRLLGPTQATGTRKDAFNTLDEGYQDYVLLTVEEAQKFSPAAPGWLLVRTAPGEVVAFKQGRGLYSKTGTEGRGRYSETGTEGLIEKTWVVFEKRTGLTRQLVLGMRDLTQRLHEIVGA